MISKEHFLDILNIEPIYETEGIFYEPFWEFMSRFQSLHRNWEINKMFNQFHLNNLNIELENKVNELEHYNFYDNVRADIEYFPDHLRASTLSLAISYFENLLVELSNEVASDLNSKIILDTRPLPIINKYILWLKRNCELEITISKVTNRKLDAIRGVRNRFIHNISRDIPENIRKTIDEMNNVEGEHSRNKVTDGFVDESLKEIILVVKNLEMAYIKFYEKIK
ncbi:hypothetical protein ATO12_17145 [Aquimarina atlantica]|uniref:RiboL-PSP-HEPN domain-containing protein n=1 Tax=Aquimarina atlantica TaxID=1317122 RepID=A0A023BUF4_9FLAO|nr:hypothetical protein [Aquimarina atlantica]EZH73662.1 hypothetical protein ATO12_17145 [Aquimarina atlantica]